MFSRPAMLRVDICTGCQLKCPACPTASGKVAEKLGTGRMSLDKLKQLLDENPRVRHIELSNWGEIFLNKDLAEIIKFAWERGVKLHADNGVNLNHAPPEVLEAMVRYRFSSMTCSIDGASAEIYPLYRVGGDYERVLGHIRRINELKKKYKSGLPKLTWQFVVFEHNAHEKDKARAQARALGMRFFFINSWDNLDIQTEAAAADKTGAKSGATKIARRRKIFQRPDINHGICAQLWNDPQINWDGKVLGCCVNDWSNFGNAFEEGLQNVLTGERFTYAKDMLQGARPPRADIPCTTCHFYVNMQKTGTWMTKDFINRNDFYWRVLLFFNVNAKWAGGIYVQLRDTWYDLLDMAERVIGRLKWKPSGLV